MSPHPRGEDNAVCMTCGGGFHRAPTSKLRRCDMCRTGMQGRRQGKPKTSRVCPVCGGRKSRTAQRCRSCWGMVKEAVKHLTVHDNVGEVAAANASLERLPEGGC